MRFVQMKNYSKKVNFLLRKKISLLIEPVYFFLQFQFKTFDGGNAQKRADNGNILFIFSAQPCIPGVNFQFEKSLRLANQNDAHKAYGTSNNSENVGFQFQQH